ncbi:MAG: hypothetical protein ACETWG_08950, partial [Candidatus Neomarinimicrobiota bacterium]
AALGSLGKYINLITATIHSPEKPLVDLTAPRRTLNYVEKSLERLRSNKPKDTPLEELYAANPTILKRIQVLREREAEARQTIEKAVNTIQSERISLGQSISDDQELLALVNKAIQAIEKAAASSPVEKAGESAPPLAP